MKKVPNKRWKEISERLKEHLTSVEQLQNFIEELEQEGFEKAAQTCERFMFGLFNYKDYPRNHWRRIRTTNMMERLNKELKRRSKVVGAFPNDDSLLRLVVSILMNINEEWITGRRYLTM